ncbi:MAG: ABC transporter substrate-binding protein, partial [Pseudomonadales bacterium]
MRCNQLVNTDKHLLATSFIRSWTSSLRQCAAGLGIVASLFSGALAQAELGEPEKDELTFGFIKLTDMAPIAIAYENGYFEDEGLYVTI